MYVRYEASLFTYLLQTSFQRLGISREDKNTAVPQQLQFLDAGKEGGCDFSSRRCEEGAVCVGFRALVEGSAGRGRCLRGTAKYVPSYSTRFGCKVRVPMFGPAHLGSID